MRCFRGIRFENRRNRNEPQKSQEALVGHSRLRGNAGTAVSFPTWQGIVHLCGKRRTDACNALAGRAVQAPRGLALRFNGHGSAVCDMSRGLAVGPAPRLPHGRACGPFPPPCLCVSGASVPPRQRIRPAVRDGVPQTWTTPTWRRFWFSRFLAVSVVSAVLTRRGRCGWRRVFRFRSCPAPDPT